MVFILSLHIDIIIYLCTEYIQLYGTDTAYLSSHGVTVAQFSIAWTVNVEMRLKLSCDLNLGYTCLGLNIGTYICTIL